MGRGLRGTAGFTLRLTSVLSVEPESEDMGRVGETGLSRELAIRQY